MNILALSYSFPHDSHPYRGVFVRSTLQEFVALGHQVTVIAPQAVVRDRRMPIETSQAGMRVIRPRFVSAGAKRIAGLNSYAFTQSMFEQAVLRRASSVKPETEVIYSHFMLPSGLAALRLGKRLPRPVFCVLGESFLEKHESKIAVAELADSYRQFDGLVFNSDHTRMVAATRYGVEANRCIVVPNGVDPCRFYVRDRTECRRKLGLPMEARIVIFVGAFVRRKGPLRVARACTRIVPSPKMVFLGSGPERPEGPDVLFAGAVDHDLLPYYLGAGDVFALPTIGEGMPNAVLEALACGTTVVTSRIEPNVQILGTDYPYFCDPMDECDLAVKISSALRDRSPGGQVRFTWRDRASAIIEFMESRM